MPTYFKPLRRKIGVVILVMTCAFAAGWVRSQSVSDTVGFREEGLTNALVSHQGRIYLMRMIPDKKDHNTPNRSQFTWNSVSLSDPNEITRELPELKWQFCGIGRRELSVPGVTFIVYEVDYWSIVVPLTAIAAWLLLLKPRSKIAPPITSASENA